MNVAPTDSHAQPSDPPLPYQPAPPIRVFLAVLVALGGGIGLVRCLDDARRDSVTGYLHAERVPIVADRDAVIQQIVAAPGTVVQAGSPLITLADDSLQQEIADKQQEFAALQTELEQAKAKAEIELAWRTKELDEAVFDTKLRSAGFLKDQLAYQVENFAWTSFIENRGNLRAAVEPDSVFRSVTFEDSVTPEESRMRAMLRQGHAQNALEVNSVQVEICDKRLKELEQLRIELPEKVRRAVGVDVAESRLVRAAEELENLKSRQDTLTLKASAYGTVGIYHAQPGEKISAGSPLVELLDPDRRFVIAHVPTDRLGEFTPGTEVRLEFGDGNVRNGRVRDIPPQAQSFGQLTATPEDNQAVLLVRIEPSGKLWPELPIGATVKIRPQSNPNDSSAAGR